MNTTACRGGHIGRCTTGPTFTRAEAEQKLRDLGWAWREETAEWVREDRRGRLAWQPDYCRPDDADRGTRFWLTFPHAGPGNVGLEVLP